MKANKTTQAENVGEAGTNVGQIEMGNKKFQKEFTKRKCASFILRSSPEFKYSEKDGDGLTVTCVLVFR